MDDGGVSVISDDVQGDITGIDEYHYKYIKLKCDSDITRRLSWDNRTGTIKLDGLRDDNTSKTSTLKIANEAKNASRRVIDLQENELGKAKEVVANWKDEGSVFFLDESICSKELIIMAPSDNSMQRIEHKVKLCIGRMKITQRNPDRFSSLTSAIDDTENSPEDDSSLYDTYRSFVTFEKIRVHVGNKDLTAMEEDVDCIVNPINVRNTASGHISAALLKTGGASFAEAFSDVHDVEMTQCHVTSGGDLKVKHVMHAVCPKKSPFSQGDMLEENIFKTVENCLLKAEEMHIDSIAFPTICAGRRRIPIDICSQQYANAILEFSRKRKNLFVVTDIYFVDISKENITDLSSTFRESIPEHTYELLEIPKVQPSAIGIRASFPQRTASYIGIEVKQKECKTDSQGDPPYENVFSDPPYENEASDPPYENEAIDPPYENEASLKSQQSNTYEEMCNNLYASEQNEVEGRVGSKEEITGVQAKEVEGRVDSKEEITGVQAKEVEGRVDSKEEITGVQAKEVHSEAAADDDNENRQTTQNSCIDQIYKSVDGGDDDGGDDDDDNYTKIDQPDSAGYDTIANASVGLGSDETLSIENKLTNENATQVQHGVEAKKHEQGGADQTHRGSAVVQDSRYISDRFSSVSFKDSTYDKTITGRIKTKNGCVILAYKDDIRDIPVDAVVCPEKITRRRGGVLAAAIKATFRHSFKEQKLEKLRKKNRNRGSKHIAVTECEKESKDVKYILHTATPFRSDSIDDDAFRQGLIQCLPRVFKKIEDHKKRRKIKTVAFPLMGIDNVQDVPVVHTACRVLAESVVACCEVQTTVREIHLVNKCPTITKWLIELLEDKVT